MDQIVSILNDQTLVGYLATVDNGKPRVRPWGFMFEEDGRLYFCTAETKEAYKQLMAVPYIEYSKTTGEMVWVRVSGEIRFDNDIKKKEKCFERYPSLKNIYNSPENPIFKTFYLEHGEAAIQDFSLNPPRIIKF